MYTYCGHLALLLLILAPAWILLRRERRSKWLWLSFGLTLASAYWMLGQSTPGYTAIFTRLPRMIRGSVYAEYALLPFSLWVALTAALSLRDLRLPHSAALAWVVALAAAVNLLAVSFQPRHEYRDRELPPAEFRVCTGRQRNAGPENSTVDSDFRSTRALGLSESRLFFAEQRRRNVSAAFAPWATTRS